MRGSGSDCDGGVLVVMMVTQVEIDEVGLPSTLQACNFRGGVEGEVVMGVTINTFKLATKGGLG